MPSREKTKLEILADGTKARIKEEEYLIGLAEIACFMRCSISTVRKYIRLYGLPAARLENKLGSPVRTTKALINSWIAGQHLNFLEQNHWLREEEPTRDQT